MFKSLITIENSVRRVVMVTASHCRSSKGGVEPMDLRNEALSLNRMNTLMDDVLDGKR